jgi:hypothetical protein
MSRPVSSSGVYGFTEAMLGTFERIKNVGKISSNDATATAITTQTVKRSGRRSQKRCQVASAK